MIRFTTLGVGMESLCVESLCEVAPPGVEEEVRVEPTICLTEPEWRSMQGRKRVIVFLFFLFFSRMRGGGGESR